MRPTRLVVVALLATTTALHAQNVLDHVSLHGYLSEAYGRTDSATIWGLTRAGTAAYRRAALQLSFDPTATDRVVVQAAHRKNGNSATLDRDVILDWAFYRHRFATSTALGAGRLPIPIGLSNETRYVGTLNPFFRVPFVMYTEGLFASESIDGVVLAQDLFDGSRLPITAEAYGGTFTFTDQSLSPMPGAPAGLRRSRGSDVLGGRLWLTPLSPLRVGVGGLRYVQKDGPNQLPGETVHKSELYSSAELSLDRAVIRAESRAAIAPGSRLWGYYVQGGVHVVGGLRLTAERQWADGRFDVPMLGTLKVMFTRANAVSASYALRTGVVLKAELHDENGRMADGASLLGPALRTRYVITSFALSH